MTRWHTTPRTRGHELSVNERARAIIRVRVPRDEEGPVSSSGNQELPGELDVPLRADGSERSMADSSANVLLPQ